MSGVSPVNSKVKDAPVVVMLTLWSAPSGWARYLRATVCDSESGLAMVTVTLAVVTPGSPNCTSVMVPPSAGGR